MLSLFIIKQKFLFCMIYLTITRNKVNILKNLKFLKNPTFSSPIDINMCYTYLQPHSHFPIVVLLSQITKCVLNYYQNDAKVKSGIHSCFVMHVHVYRHWDCKYLAWFLLWILGIKLRSHVFEVSISLTELSPPVPVYSLETTCTQKMPEESCKYELSLEKQKVSLQTLGQQPLVCSVEE